MRSIRKGNDVRNLEILVSMLSVPVTKKIGFKWLAISILKLIVGVATIAYIEQFIVLGIIGIIATLFFAWEQFTEYKRLSKLE